jgi:hypothetical protein
MPQAFTQDVVPLLIPEDFWKMTLSTLSLSKTLLLHATLVEKEIIY